LAPVAVIFIGDPQSSHNTFSHQQSSCIVLINSKQFHRLLEAIRDVVDGWARAPDGLAFDHPPATTALLKRKVH
jgi:hypothetical protein